MGNSNKNSSQVKNEAVHENAEQPEITLVPTDSTPVEEPKKSVKFFNPTSGLLTFNVANDKEITFQGNATLDVSEEDSQYLLGSVLIQLPK